MTMLSHAVPLVKVLSPMKDRLHSFIHKKQNAPSTDSVPGTPDTAMKEAVLTLPELPVRQAQGTAGQAAVARHLRAAPKSPGRHGSPEQRVGSAALQSGRAPWRS